MSNGRRVAKNATVQAVAFAAQGLTQFVVALILARIAGAERLGEFITLVILAGLFAFISAFGLPGLLTREIARLRDDREQVSRLMNAAVGLVAILSIVAFFLMLVVGVVSGYSTLLLRALILTAVALAFESMAMVVAAPFRGVEALERSSAVTAVMEIAFLLLALAAILLDSRIDSLMAAYLGARMIALVVAVWLYQSRFGRLRPAFDRKLWRTLLKEGFPFSVNSVFSFAYSRADVVALSYLAGNVVVGFYEVAYSLTMRMNIVTRAVTHALYPLLSFQFPRDRRSVWAYTADCIHFLNIPGFLIATIVWVFGPELIRLLYGQVFAEATSAAVRWLALAVPLRFLETSLGVALDASNRAGQRATAVAIAAVTNLLLNVMLIPTFNMMGAVYATVSTEVVILTLFVWHLRDEAREIIEWRAFFAPGLGTLMILAGLYLFNGMNTWLSMALSVVLYALAIVAFDPSSIQSVRQLATGRQP